MWRYAIILIILLIIVYFLLFHIDTIKEYIIKYWKIIASILIIGIIYILWQSDIIEHNIQLGGSNKKTKYKIKFMQFNIENGGMLVDFSKVIDAIKLANPDIVAIEEANGNMKLIAEKAGFPYYDVRTQIMSQYPIIDPNDAEGVYVFIEIDHNKVIAVSNVHLPSDPYGPDELHKGESHRKVTKLEKELRLFALQKQIKVLPKLQKLPIFLAGDFNAPSHLDCKLDQEKCFTWPISLTLEKIGFIDAFREVYPDPNKEHGYTWWANRPKVKDDWNPTINDKHDRIDFVYVLGPVKTESGKIIGESHITPWPSDHRAIVFDFTVKLVNPPTYISVNKRLFNNNDKITIKYNISKNINNEKIVIRKINHNNNLKEFSIQDTYGDIVINNNDLDPGHYEALLMLRDKILARTPFSIKLNTKVTHITEVTTDKKTYSIGEKIKVNWTNAPGNRFDWVVIKKEDASENDDIIHWVKTGATIYGSHTFQKNNTDEWPLNPGIYDVIYMIDDSHKSIARTKIHVQ